MTEKQLQNAIVEMARFRGWYVAHFRPASSSKGWRTPVEYDGRGFPDLVLVRERVVFAELKARDSGKLGDAQVEWARRLAKAGAEWHFWTPKDWTSGKIDEILAHRPAVRVTGPDTLVTNGPEKD